MKAFTSRMKALSDGMSDLMGTEKSSSDMATRLSALSPEDQALVKKFGVTWAEEEELVREFRQQLLAAGPLPELMDHIYLRRFLRARQHQLPKALAMARDHLEWRRGNGVDAILETFHFHERGAFFQCYPDGYFCTDRCGRPIFLSQPGKIDTEELWKFTELERCIKYHIQVQERYIKHYLPAASIASGRVQHQSLVIIDMDGVGVSTLTGEVRKILATVMALDQDNYPELMYKTLILNAPTSFRVLWAMVRQLMDERTQAKFEVLPADFQEALQQYVAPENLMQKYGGTHSASLLDEPGPWKDPAVQAEVAARGRTWWEGLPDVEVEVANHVARGGSDKRES